MLLHYIYVPSEEAPLFLFIWMRGNAIDITSGPDEQVLFLSNYSLR